MRIERLAFVQGDRGALGAANNGSSEVQCGHAGRAAPKDEAGQRFQPVVHLVDLDLETGNLACHDAQGAFELAGRGDVGSEVEQVVLDLQQLYLNIVAAKGGDRDSDCGIGFVDLTDRG